MDPEKEAELRAILARSGVLAADQAAIMQTINKNLSTASRTASEFGRTAGALKTGVTAVYEGLKGFVNETANEQRQPLEVGLSAIQTAFRSTEGVLKGLGSAGDKHFAGLSGLGETLMNALGKLPSVLGKVAGSAVGLAADGFDLLAAELVRNYNGYQNITKSGVLLGDGLTELAVRTKESGLPMKAFIQGLGLARSSLSNMGLGTGDATAKVSSVMGELVNGSEKYTESLGALGYSTEEQVALVAQQLANDRAAGVTTKKTQSELAKDTLELGKNMRVLSDITGKDAKAAMEQARVQSMEADLLARAEAQGGADARAKLQQQLATMPDEVKKGYLEFVSTGGQAVADAATNVAMESNPKLREFYQQQFSILSQGNVNAAEAQKLTMTGLETVAKYAKENATSTADIATGARLTGDALLQGATTINNALIRMSTQFGEGVTEKSKTSADKLASKTDELTKTVEQISRVGTQIQASVQDTLRIPLKEFSTGVNYFTEQLGIGTKKANEALRELYGEFIKTKNEAGAANRATTQAQERPRKIPEAAPPQQSQEKIPEAAPKRTPKIPEAAPRAFGGDVHPNKTYLVGERGPELLAAREMGTIFNNEQTKIITAFKELSTAMIDKKPTDSKTDTRVESDKTFQNEMLSVLREQSLLLRTNIDVTKEMISSLDEISAIQSRIADARA